MWVLKRGYKFEEIEAKKEMIHFLDVLCKTAHTLNRMSKETLEAFQGQN
jgi:hypothetical protein